METGFNLKVVNEKGVIILDKVINNNSLNYTLDISSWVPGFYIIHVYSGFRVYTGKVVVVK